MEPGVWVVTVETHFGSQKRMVAARQIINRKRLAHRV